MGEKIYPEEINEYALSKADLVIRRENSKEDNMSCCMVSLIKDDNNCNIDKVQGMVAEHTYRCVYLVIAFIEA